MENSALHNSERVLISLFLHFAIACSFSPWFLVVVSSSPPQAQAQSPDIQHQGRCCQPWLVSPITSVLQKVTPEWRETLPFTPGKRESRRPKNKPNSHDSPTQRPRVCLYICIFPVVYCVLRIRGQKRAAFISTHLDSKEERRCRVFSVPATLPPGRRAQWPYTAVHIHHPSPRREIKTTDSLPPPLKGCPCSVRRPQERTGDHARLELKKKKNPPKHPPPPPWPKAPTLATCICKSVARMKWLKKWINRLFFKLKGLSNAFVTPGEKAHWNTSSIPFRTD